MIKRQLQLSIKKWLDREKTILILGPRQTGKTTLLKTITREMKSVLWLDCDNQKSEVRNLISEIREKGICSLAFVGLNWKMFRGKGNQKSEVRNLMS